MFLVMFPGVAKLGNICFERKICVREAKMFLTPGKNTFCFRAAKFVSATRVSRAAKLGNICIRINVSATMLLSLASWPLGSLSNHDDDDGNKNPINLHI